MVNFAYSTYNFLNMNEPNKKDQLYTLVIPHKNIFNSLFWENFQVTNYTNSYFIRLPKERCNMLLI